MSEYLLEKAYLPLYSESVAEGRFVPARNSLNMWNASGRPRDENEIGIPVPVEFRNKHSDFFPGVLEPFDLVLPNGITLSAKQCQQGGKALMSNPNKDLGKWLLRDILKVPVLTIVTYKMLYDRGIDSVCIEKWYCMTGIYYKIFPAEINSYDYYIRGGKKTSIYTAGMSAHRDNNYQSGKKTVSRKDIIGKGTLINHPAFGVGKVKSISKGLVKVSFKDKDREIKYDWLVSHGIIKREQEE